MIERVEERHESVQYGHSNMAHGTKYKNGLKPWKSLKRGLLAASQEQVTLLSITA